MNACGEDAAMLRLYCSIVDGKMHQLRTAMKAIGKRNRKKREQTTEVNEVAIRLRVEPLKEGGYLATSIDVPGLVAEGRSVTEAVEIAQGLGRKIIESCLEHGDPLPPVFAKATSDPQDFVVPVGIR